jgi:enoyl-[acyl-carrier protein] reductase I
MVFAKSMEILGGKIDFLLHSIGMSPNVRKKRTYDDLDYNLMIFPYLSIFTAM